MVVLNKAVILEFIMLDEKQKQNDLYWLEVAKLIGRKSKCKRRKVGSLILDIYGRMVASGRNGHPRNSFKDDFCFRYDVKSHENMNAGACIHSEQNTLLFSNFKEIQDGTMYITCPPCEYCSPLIMQAGILRLVYLKDGFDEPGIELLRNLGADKLMEIISYEPN